MPKRRASDNRSPGTPANWRIVAPPEYERFALLYGPYSPPATRIGKWITCQLRGKAKVCGWSDGLIPWPRIRVGRGGKGAYVITPDLARAIRFESSAAIMHWWGVGSVTVSHWRRALGVEQFNEGTQKLYSLWKEPKLPNQCVKYSWTEMRKRRLATGMTAREVAEAMGWKTPNSYSQMEFGTRRSTKAQTLERLAKVLGCEGKDLTLDGKSP